MAAAFKFPQVNASLGAPMGRQSTALPDGPTEIIPVHIRQDGTDNGGAYWGILRKGERMYCLTDKKGYFKFHRATSKKAARLHFAKYNLPK